MVKLMKLEWKKLKQKVVISEIMIYVGILMFLPTFFIKMVSQDFGDSYSQIIQLILSMHMGFVLFGASLINQVVIDEFKNRTISLSYGYPISRKKLVTAKVLFIAIFVFCCTIVSFLLTGITTYLLDQIFHIINGQPTIVDVTTFFRKMIGHTFMITLISLIPLYFFGIWKRATVPAVLCAIFLMQFQNFFYLLNIDLNPEIVKVGLCLIGAASVYLSIKLVDKVGDL
ncbi:ABC transporter permease [Peribacillus alkalitolerans]|uniref:ABC transporter permease n=1 Tax=Peribacillus alkalitolerans TaxID=1550385 RepID=UPI0013D38F2D|nr:ABC transporter permease [Peribacillus alkalitolerans]